VVDAVLFINEHDNINNNFECIAVTNLSVFTTPFYHIILRPIYQQVADVAGIDFVQFGYNWCI